MYRPTKSYPLQSCSYYIERDIWAQKWKKKLSTQLLLASPPADRKKAYLKYKQMITWVSQSPPCRIKRQEYYPETERVCGARAGGWLPQLVFDP